MGVHRATRQCDSILRRLWRKNSAGHSTRNWKKPKSKSTRLSAPSTTWTQRLDSETSASMPIRNPSRFICDAPLQQRQCCLNSKVNTPGTIRLALNVSNPDTHSPSARTSTHAHTCFNTPHQKTNGKQANMQPSARTSLDLVRRSCNTRPIHVCLSRDTQCLTACSKSSRTTSVCTRGPDTKYHVHVLVQPSTNVVFWVALARANLPRIARG